jgi:hypothetical protein
MTALGTARCELFTTLGCASGTRIAAGGFVPVSVASSTESLEGDESATLTIPGTAEAASIVRERQTIRLWRSDSDYEEWIVGPVSRTRNQGAHVDVTCRPPLYLLGEVGLVPDIVASSDGLPRLDGGVSGLTPTQIITNYITTNPPIMAILPWLSVGTIEFTDPIPVFEWSRLTPLQFLRSLADTILNTLDVGQSCELAPLRRVSNTSYAIDLLAQIGG